MVYAYSIERSIVDLGYEGDSLKAEIKDWFMEESCEKALHSDAA